ncbi:hypothetical protein [Ammoniphilus sp. 3BR4]|uniref:DUF6843 domain-containing protein n=1 Tax=Ammoniphilus sp. 3BR4 TaxID=3158265 RepID=UPI0034673736
MKKFYIIGFSLFVLIFVSPIFLFDDEVKHLYLLPNGYTGWVEITYTQYEYPPLTEEQNNSLFYKSQTIISINVPKTGVVKTSSEFKAGLMEFYYVDSKGNGQRIGQNPEMIHGFSVGDHEVHHADGKVEKFPTVERFFVGTEQQWEQEVKKLKENET